MSVNLVSSRPSQLLDSWSISNLPARAMEASLRWGIWFEMSMSRVPIVPCQGLLFLRSTSMGSSPEMLSNRDRITDWSERPDSRASPIVATFLPMSSWRPNFSPSVARLVPRAPPGPSRPMRTRPIVPFPLRVGPMIVKIFCCDVSWTRHNPNHSRISPWASTSPGRI